MTLRPLSPSRVTPASGLPLMPSNAESITGEASSIPTRLKPHPQACHEANLTRGAPILAHKGGGLAKTPVEGDADIGGKLASDFIAHPHPEFEVVEPRTGREFLDSLYGGVGLEAGLEDQSLRQQQVLRQRQPGGDRAVLIDEQRGLEFVVVRHESLDADHAKPTGHVAAAERLSLDAWTDLEIVVFLDEPAIQQLKVHVVVCFEGGVLLPFAFEPESIVVPAVPALDVPPVVVIPLTPTGFRTVFEDVDESEETVLLIVDGSRPVARRGQLRPWTFPHGGRTGGHRGLGSGSADWGLSVWDHISHR